jgi:hypothetical protein
MFRTLVFLSITAVLVLGQDLAQAHEGAHGHGGTPTGISVQMVKASSNILAEDSRCPVSEGYCCPCPCCPSSDAPLANVSHGGIGLYLAGSPARVSIRHDEVLASISPERDPPVPRQFV